MSSAPSGRSPQRVRASVAAFVALFATLFGAGLGRLFVGVSEAAPGGDPAGQGQVAAPVIRMADATAADRSVVLDVLYHGADAERAEVTENGRPVTEVTVAPLDEVVPTALLVVLDNSSGIRNGTLQRFKTALAALEAGKQGIDRIGLVTIGGGANLITDLGNEQAWSEALESVDWRADGDAALWDGLFLAGRTLQDARLAEPDLRADVVVVSASTDTNSSHGRAEATQALARAEAGVHLVAVGPAGGEPGGLASVLGGSQRTVGLDGVGDAVHQVASAMDDRWAVTFGSRSGDGVQRVGVTFPQGKTAASYQRGARLASPDRLTPIPEDRASWTDRLKAPWVRWVAIALGAVAAVGLAWAVANLALGEVNTVDDRLAGYDVLRDTHEEDDDGAQLGSSEIIRRAVAATEAFADRRGVLDNIERGLERADLNFRPGEVLFLWLVLPVLATVGTWAATSSPFVALLALLIGIALPRLVLSFLVGRRRRRFLGQLPDMLQILAGTLKAGYAITQGLEVVSQEVEDPMGKELRRVMAEARLGKPLDAALDGMARRMECQDFDWCVMAINIQREVGGNLAELLLTVADTMVQRERLRRDVRTLTAEGRMSAYVIGALPFALGGFLMLANPTYLRPLWTSTAGLMMLAGGGVAMVLGIFFMKKTITVEV